MTFNQQKLGQLKRLVNTLHKEQKAYNKRRIDGRVSSCKLEIDCHYLDELAVLIHSCVLELGFDSIVYDNVNIGGHNHGR